MPKIDDLTQLAVAPDPIDELAIVDKSAGTTKKIATSDFLAKTFPASIYELLATSSGRVTTAGASGTTYLLAPGSADYAAAGFQNTGGSAVPLIRFESGLYIVPGLTGKMQLGGAIMCPTTNPAVTVTLALYPASVSGLNWSLGAAVQTLAIATAGGTIVSNKTADFTVPADGDYVLGYTLSGTPASGFDIQARLRMRSV